MDGHLVRMGEMRNSYESLVEKFQEERSDVNYRPK
jgi:hypothetical protein